MIHIEVKTTLPPGRCFPFSLETARSDRRDICGRKQDPSSEKRHFTRVVKIVYRITWGSNGRNQTGELISLAGIYQGGDRRG
jgi:hypothetical protein